MPFASLSSANLDQNRNYSQIYPPATNTSTNTYSGYNTSLSLPQMPQMPQMPVQPFLMDITLSYPHTHVSNPIPPPLSISNNSSSSLQMQCRQCMGYMAKLGEVLKMNEKLSRDLSQMTQLKAAYEAQSQQLMQENQELRRQQQQQQQKEIEGLYREESTASRSRSHHVHGEEARPRAPHEHHVQRLDSMMSISSNCKHGNVERILSPSSSRQGQMAEIPLDDLAKTPKELQPLRAFSEQFAMDSHSAPITPYGDGINSRFAFPAESAQTGNAGKGAPATASVMSVCSNTYF